MNRHHVALAAMVVVTMMMAACGPYRPSQTTYTPRPTIVDRGLAFGFPCRPPCWEGLTPGISTADETRQTLERLRESGLISSYACGEGGCTAATVYIFFKNGIIEEIYGNVAFYFDLQQLIRLMGAPTCVWAHRPYNVPTCNCEAAHATTPSPGGLHDPDLYISFYYPEKGAMFSAEALPQEPGCICPYMRIVSFSYAPPSNGEIPEGFVPWPGFGPVYGK